MANRAATPSGLISSSDWPASEINISLRLTTPAIWSIWTIREDLPTKFCGSSIQAERHECFVVPQSWKKGRSRLQSNGLVIAPTEQGAGHLQGLTLVPQFGDYGVIRQVELKHWP